MTALYREKIGCWKIFKDSFYRSPGSCVFEKY